MESLTLTETKVEDELNRLVDLGIIEPVQTAEWAAPIVCVVKKDNQSIHICGDFKCTVNAVSKLDRYPIPKIEDLFAKLAGGKNIFQVRYVPGLSTSPACRGKQQYVVVNTHKGLFKYNRLPFGVSSAPGIFQRIMEDLLRDIPHVIVYLDDILITGVTEAEHAANLEKVLNRLEKAGLRC